MTLTNAPTAHLLIGLGGLGSQAVRRAAQVLARRAPSGHPLPVRCLGIDTDEGVAGPSHVDSYEGFLLGTAEFATVATRPHDYPPVTAWLPDEMPSVEPGKGVRGSRGLGRLAFFLHRRDLERRVAGTLARIGGADPAHPVDPTPQVLQVLLISSLGGGTGSGMLNDVAYMVHRLMRDVPIPYKCESILLMATRPTRDEAVAANVYSAMVELNHWMSADTNYAFEYSSGEVWDTSRPPFDQVYLLAAADLAENSERDLLFAQISAHVGLSLWEEYAPLQAEIARRQELFFRGADLRGNPVAYFSAGSATLNLPFKDLNLAMTARIAARVVNRWRTTLFRSGGGGSSEGTRHAEHFLLSQNLTTASVRRGLEEDLLAVEGGRFRLSEQLARVREELAKAPLYAAPLARHLTELDGRLGRDFAADGPEGVAAYLGGRSADLLQNRSAALVRELSSFFRAGREEYLGFCVFLDQLSERISHNLNDLHEALSRREAGELRLADEKRAALQAVAQYDPGFLGRLVKKPRDGPVERCLQVLHDYHENRLRIYLDREALNVYLGLMDTLQRFSAGVTELLNYLDAVEQDLAAEESHAMERLFSVPGEVLLTRAEVDRFLNDQSSPERVARATENLLSQVGQDLFSLPRTTKRSVWVGRILTALMEAEPPPQADVVDRFLARYPGEAARDQLRILFERARPSVSPTTAIPDYEPGTEPRAAFVGLYGGAETGSSAKGLLQEHLARIPTEVPLTVLPILGRERVVFVRLSGGFPLSALDLHQYHRAYIQSLRLGRRRLHTRRDVRWRALGRPSRTQLQEMREALAIGLHLRMLQEASRGGDPVERLESPRWPDLTSLRACLHLYADTFEAFHVELDFLTALRRWQDQKVDEIGAEGYRRALAGERHPLRFLGLDLDADLGRAVTSFDARLEEKWPQWKRAIARALQQEPSVAATDLVAVPVGVRRWAMLRYIQENPDESLTYHAASGRLELVSARDVETFDRHWRRLQESLEGDVETFGEHARDLIKFLCNCLGFTVGDALGLGNLRGLRVGTHGLRIKIPSKIPILISRVPSLSPEDVEALRSLMEQGGLDSRFALLLTPGDPRQNIAVIDENLRTLLRYDVIVLTQDDLRNVLRVRWRMKALVARILEQVDLTVVSPFVTEGPVPSSMFFGREGEIKEILHRIETSSLALIGPRRIGKTSILQRVLASLRNRPRPIVYLDCQSVYDAPSFMQQLAMEYAPAMTEAELASPAVFRNILEALRAGYAGAPVQFILDEVDLVLREDPEGAEGLFRSFRIADNEGAAHFLFCGERTLQQRLRDPNSALYNFCHSIRIQFLEPRDASRLIAEPMEQMEVRWEDMEGTLARILEVTSAHPNLIQRTCSNVVERLNQERTRTIKREHVEEVIADPGYVEEYLDTLWGRSSEVEKVLSLSFEPEEALSPPEIRRRLQEEHEIELPLPEVVDSLDTLCLFGLLEKRGSRYQFAARHFPHLVREVMDVTEEIQLHKEMMMHGG